MTRLIEIGRKAQTQNKFHKMINYFLKNRGPKIGPLNFLFLQPTSFCNLACKYCYLPDTTINKKMSIQTIEEVIKWIRNSDLEFVKSHPLQVIWHAGEPLFCSPKYYKEAFELFKTNLSNVSIEHIIQTNGTLITQEFCDLFKDYNVRIGISIDGPPDIHDLNRVDKHGKGSFSATCRGIELLQKNNINFGVLSVIGKKTLLRQKEYIDFILDKNITNIGLLFEAPNAGKSNEFVGTQNDEYEEIEKFIAEMMRLSIKNKNKIQLRELRSTLQAIMSTDQNFKTSESIEQTPFTFLNVLQNGDFSTFSPDLLGEKISAPPFKDETVVFGNVYKDKLEDVLKSQIFLDTLKKIQQGSEKCKKTCEYFRFCQGGRPYYKALMNQDLSSTETIYCRVNIKSVTNVFLKNFEEFKTL